MPERVVACVLSLAVVLGLLRPRSTTRVEFPLLVTLLRSLRPGRRFPALAMLTILGLLGTAAYSNALGNDFVLDDHVVLFGPEGVENLDVAKLFATRQHFFYRPVGHLLLLASHRLFGDTKEAYHALNLLLLLAMAWLTGRIARELGAPRRAALLAALLFAVHPIHAFLVDYVTASVISTFLLLTQISFLLYLRHRATGSIALQAGSLGVFAGALLAHEMAMALPLVIATYELFRRQAPLAEALRRATAHLLLLAGFLSVRAVVSPLNLTVGGTLTALREPLRYLASLWDLLAWYLPKMLWPRDLLFLWSAPLEPIHPAAKAAALLLGVGLLAGWLLSRRRRAGLAPFLVAMFAVGLVPVAAAAFTYFPQSSPMIEPHWLYFPAVGLFVLAGLALDRLWTALGSGAGLAVAAVVLGAGVLLVRQTNAHWRDEETYSAYWLSLNDRDWTPYHGLGRARIRRGEYDAAAVALRAGSARIASLVPAVLAADLGFAEHMVGNREEGSRWLLHAASIDPGYAQTWYYLGSMALDEGDLAAAEERLARAVTLFPSSTEFRQRLEEVRRRRASSPSKGRR